MLSNTAARLRRRVRRQRGFGILEFAVVLALVGIVAAGVLAYVQNANSGQKSNAAIDQLTVIQQAVHSLYNMSQPDYSNLNSQVLANSTFLPKRMISGSGASVTLRHSYNGAITVAPTTIAGGATNNGFSVAFLTLPADACVKFSTLDFGTGVFDVKIQGSSTVTKSGPFPPDEATSACNPSGDNTVTWRFY